MLVLRLARKMSYSKAWPSLSEVLFIDWKPKTYISRLDPNF
jgi:hypothetical protein